MVSAPTKIAERASPKWITDMNRYPVFFEETFLNEGYFQKLPKDKGNWYKGKLYGTICGITARDHFKEFKIAYELYDMKCFESLKTYAMNFYKKKGYWKDGFNDIADSSLAFKLFDLGVNMGQMTAIKLLQKTLIKHYDIDIMPTGILTQETIQEANRAFLSPSNGKYSINYVEGESVLYACYIHEANKYYKSLKGFGRFGRTWLRRLFTTNNDAPNILNIDIAARPPERIKLNC